ncbi:M-phase phosphoprotein 8 [Toxocara canis]|uniref:M-phase phosphoprotein 8 n=1 Tax=Toxocara canis TaxID=6265 RepID=A0A0B2V5D4_TOXCA|nr:M-phase phosphoprotein 8 [Toxocara canis]
MCLTLVVCAHRKQLCFMLLKHIGVLFERVCEAQRMSANSSGETFEVEKIIAVRTDDTGRTLYKVRWLGFTEDDDTWEPYENLTEDCDRLIKTFYENEMHEQENRDGDCDTAQASGGASDSRNNEDRRSISEENCGVRSQSVYETVEVLTPEAWNRFGDLDKREIANLFIENRIPSQTEKVLCAIGYDVGRVTRNKLRTVLKTSPSPVKEIASAPKVSKGRRGGRGKKQGRKEEGSAFPPQKVRDGEGGEMEEGLLCGSECDAESAMSLDLTAGVEAQTIDGVMNEKVSGEALSSSTQSEQSGTAPKRRSRKKQSDSNRGTRGGKSSRGVRTGTRGRGGLRGARSGATARGGSRGRRRITVAASSKEPTTPEALEIGDDQVVKDGTPFSLLAASAKREEGNTSTMNGDIPNEKANETVQNTDHYASIQQSEDVQVDATQVSDVQRVVRKKPSASRKKRVNKGNVGDCEEGSEVSTKKLRLQCGNQERFTPSPLEVREVGNKAGAEKTATGSNGREQSVPVASAVGVSDDAGEGTTIRRELSIPAATHMTAASTPSLQNQALRNAVLEGHLSGARWTARCPAERRGYDFNQSYRGKTLAYELCERKCNVWSSSHENDDMLRVLVMGGARLDIPEEHRLRTPLHAAVENGSWCLARTLLYLRSPVNVLDADKKTPLHLAVQSSDPAAVRTIYLLLEFGADVNDIIRTLRDNRHRRKLEEHQRKITEAFEEARMKTFM